MCETILANDTAGLEVSLFFERHPKKRLFFFYIWILFCLDVVPGAVGRVGDGRRLTANDCITELTSSEIPVTLLHGE